MGTREKTRIWEIGREKLAARREEKGSICFSCNFVFLPLVT